VNRLVLRCMDPANRTGTVDIPLTRNGQPVQGEEGDISTVTVKAEWLTVDPMQEADEALLAVTMNSITNMPARFTGPYHVRVSNATKCGHHVQSDSTRKSFQMESQDTAPQVFRRIKHLAADAKTPHKIAFLVGLSHGLVKKALALPAVKNASDEDLDPEWIRLAQNELQAKRA